MSLVFTQSNMPYNSTIPIYRDYEHNENNCLYSSEKNFVFYSDAKPTHLFELIRNSLLGTNLCMI